MSLSPIADDPRVRRQVDVLVQAGHEVVAVGLRARLADPPEWKQIVVEWPVLDRVERILEGARLAGAWLGIGPALFARSSRVRRLIDIVESVDADVLHAHDWVSLGVAQHVAERQGARLAYDSHEFASGQYRNSLRWRLTKAPMIRAVESRALANAELVTTVSSGLAQLLMTTFGLQRQPLVMRSVPTYQETAGHSVTEPIEFLYHGVVSAGRGLELLIDSVPMWRSQRRLVIRGPGSEDYLASLRRRARERGVADRVDLAAPVPVHEMVAAASSSDVGVFALPSTHAQADFVLPNKLFEYIMAGLAVVASPAPEIAGVITNHGVGVVLAGDSSRDVSQAVNALDLDDVARFRAASREAARDLCWEREQSILIDAYATLARSPKPRET